MNDDQQRSEFEDQARSVGRKTLPPEWRTGILDAALRDAGDAGAAWENVIEIAEPEPTMNVGKLEGRIRKAERRAVWSMAACFVLTLFLVAMLFRPKFGSSPAALGGAPDSIQTLSYSSWVPDEEAAFDDAGAAAPSVVTRPSAPPPPPEVAVSSGPVPATQPTRGIVVFTDDASGIKPGESDWKSGRKESRGRGRENDDGVRDSLARLSETLQSQFDQDLDVADKEMLQLQLAAGDDANFLPLKVETTPSPSPKNAPPGRVTGKHSDNSSWTGTTVSGGIFASRVSGEGEITHERLAKRKGRALSNSSSVGGGADDSYSRSTRSREEFEEEQLKFIPLGSNRGSIDAPPLDGGILQNNDTLATLPDPGQRGGEGKASQSRPSNPAPIVTTRYRSDANAMTEEVRYQLEDLTIKKAKLTKTAETALQPAGKRAVPKDLEKDATEEPWSTFSLNVSDVSFKLAKASLARGAWPAADQVRVEEFVNAFDYGDPSPRQDEKVACQIEQAAHPFLQQRNILRVSMKTAALGRAANTPLRLTVLLDKSGSMERSDRVESVQNAFQLLADQLQPGDQVTLIGFARTPRLLADRLPGNRVAELAGIVASTPSQGGTNLEQALTLAIEKAKEQMLEGGQNRIILMTDGAANLGNAEPENLSGLVESMRQQGIAFDACGVGADGLNDDILESLTRKGDGRYYFLDRPEDADAGFAKQIAGALRPAARNVKVQVKFNPNRVGRYKLYGFEKHLLNKEDFRDDSVDAAELAAEEAGNALYHVQVLPEGSGAIGTVAVRFQDTATGQMVEREWTIPYNSRAPRLEEAPTSLRLASGAALLGEKLKGSLVGDAVDMTSLANLINALPGELAFDERVKDLAQMSSRARELGGE